MKDGIRRIGVFLRGKPYQSPFTSDDNGNDFYYPWGRPGEALLISNLNQKKYLKNLYYSVWSIGLGGFLLIALLDIQNIIDDSVTIFAHSILFSSLSIFYISCIYLAKRSMELHTVPYEDRLPQRGIIFLWVGLSLSQAVMLIGDMLYISILLNIPYQVFIARFFWRLSKTKGHYLSD